MDEELICYSNAGDGKQIIWEASKLLSEIEDSKIPQGNNELKLIEVYEFTSRIIDMNLKGGPTVSNSLQNSKVEYAMVATYRMINDATQTAVVKFEWIYDNFEKRTTKTEANIIVIDKLEIQALTFTFRYVFIVEKSINKVRAYLQDTYTINEQQQYTFEFPSVDNSDNIGTIR